MAFRIEEGIERGEIDNRVKGIVQGKLWLAGRADPICLELRGNAQPDLAGCFLNFTNSQPPRPHAHLDLLHPVQRGTIGDLTASRKVRLFDVPLEHALEMVRRKEAPPSHMANCLYLEWFSHANGRVVVESTHYKVTISPPAWRLTSEENEQRARDASAGMDHFVQQLSEAIEAERRGRKAAEEQWDEHDYEKLLRESDARTNKYMELLDKYGDSAEAEEQIANRMGWNRLDAQDDEQWAELEETQETEDPLQLNPQAEGVDWIRTQDGDIRHPLQHRCYESSLKLYQEAKQLGLLELNDAAVEQFLFEFQTAGAKLAGALHGLARGSRHCDGAFTVARLKRALDHVHKSQAGLEALAFKSLLPPPLIASARKELFEIREGILRLMDQFRGRQ